MFAVAWAVERFVLRKLVNQEGATLLMVTLGIAYVLEGLGQTFFGESMFSLEPNASKVVFCSLVPALAALGYTPVDSQVYTEHLARFGATEWPKARFQAALAAGLRVQPAQVWPRTAGPADPS